MPGYLLDTNVVSETRKARANHRVISFLNAADSSDLYISVLTLGELYKGIELKRLTDSSAADRLSTWVDAMETTFADRILPIDSEVARMWGELSTKRSLPVIDTLIAATAIVHSLTLVTRNTADMKATGALVLDPWS